MFNQQHCINNIAFHLHVYGGVCECIREICTLALQVYKAVTISKECVTHGIAGTGDSG